MIRCTVQVRGMLEQCLPLIRQQFRWLKISPGICIVDLRLGDLRRWTACLYGGVCDLGAAVPAPRQPAR
jgi:hypothetical protein